MTMRIFIICAIVFLVVLFKGKKAREDHPQNNYYHFTQNRVAAEWEPTNGVFFSCPPVIPKELIIELAKDTKIFPIVDSEEEQARAVGWFLKWGIDTSRVNFIKLPKVNEEVAVPRDWGPAAVFSKNGKMKLADVQFINSDPFMNLSCNDPLELQKIGGTDQDFYSVYADTLVSPLARNLGMDLLEVPIASTGGNVLTDGIGTAFSTCILLAENRFNGINDKEFFALSDSILGYNNYHVISNFEKWGIQHIDCFLKIIDEETLLVAQPPEDHELYTVYENIVTNELSKIKNVYGRPYRIKRIKLGRVVDEYLSAYTNSLILNETVYVPLYGLATDSLALETYESIMPGYTVKGFNYDRKDQPYIADWYFKKYQGFGDVPGWAPDDALHCRTRAIWDEEMIFISLNKIPAKLSVDQEAILHATIRDYGKAGFGEQAIKVFWRVNGSKIWNVETMVNDDHEYHWYAKIPIQQENSMIQYYVEATSKSGKSGRRPITAPEGHYTFKYASQQ